MELCIALDNPSQRQNLTLLETLQALEDSQKSKIWLKIGLRSFIRDGVKGLEAIKKMGDYRIFLDLKIYDIPNTMLDALNECYAIGVDMLTIHTSCGFEAMKAIAMLKAKHNDFPLVIGVSALTSFDNEGFAEIYNANVFSHTIHLAKLAYNAGIDGVVCSVSESLAIKRATDKRFLTITPGIRPFGESANDQKRVATLQDAKLAQSDFIVIGRPIYKAENPLQVVRQILSLI
ncbi:orotidine-5'-phosphate decarboxylase [Helicobacter sp. MIT 05-5293]|uniref:orotidine-5'-phosphate decarboxylase n=1 Tax=Helicobacter sp. MIT 05-5293 TaxID=1548149 RepID=UPI00051DBA10|nr:orotidine-5'-phosphate decarboxylase [Helicobacter sp. MIT 05-5293]TLD80504.1 orotidine-5'-phosphate decarboxylase [Helicobacter sp. MIT 05-5293]